MDLLEVDGKQIPMYGYMSYQPEKACYGDFRKAGVHLFFPAFMQATGASTKTVVFVPFVQDSGKATANMIFRQRKKPLN